MPLAFSSADFCSAALWSAAFCSADFWTLEFVSSLEFFWLDVAGCAGFVWPVDGAWSADFGWSAGFGCSVKGGCPEAGVMAGCAGAVLGTGDCGTPEPALGVAGLSCAQPQRPNIITRKKSDTLGERCIEFKGLPTIYLDANSSNSDGRQP
jgi:hypothetical protein